MNALRKDFPTANFVTEAARDCPFPINENTSFQSQDFILREQIKRELNASLKDITVSDRTTYDQLAYIWYAHEKGNISYEDFQKLEKYTTYWGFTYDFIFYIPIEFPLVEDGVRSTDEEYRKDIDTCITHILKTFVDDSRRMEITGTIEERTEKIKNKMFELIETGKVTV